MPPWVFVCPLVLTNTYISYEKEGSNRGDQIYPHSYRAWFYWFNHIIVNWLIYHTMAKLRDTIVEITLRVTIDGLINLTDETVPKRLMSKDVYSLLEGLSDAFHESVEEEDGLIDLKIEWKSSSHKKWLKMHSYNLNRIDSATDKLIKKPKQDENI